MDYSEILSHRWSPRGFQVSSISTDELRELFTASCWAPSSMNEQPWKWLYARREETRDFDQLLECLVEANQAWARDAACLILSLSKKKFAYKDRPNRHSMYDTGAANALLALKATDLGFQAHQMGGFEEEKTLRAFAIDPAEWEIACFIAIGREPGSAEEIIDKRNKRVRKELKDAVTSLGGEHF